MMRRRAVLPAPVDITAQTPTWFYTAGKPFQETPEPEMALPYSRCLA